MASPFAAIWVAGRLAQRELRLPWVWTDPIEPLWDELTREADEADRAAAALRHVMSWATARADDFYDRQARGREQPHGGWAGCWARRRLSRGPDDATSSPEEWVWIGFMPHVLKRLLEDAGYDVDAITRTWKDRGWLETDGEANKSRNQYKVRINHESVRVYAIRRSAAEDVEAI
jgi:hypothetical protein